MADQAESSKIPIFISPAEMPERCFSLIGRSMALAEALQAKVAKGLRDGHFDHGPEAATALGKVLNSVEKLTELHAIFEPRAADPSGARAPNSDLARAAASKLLEAVNADTHENEPEPFAINPALLRRSDRKRAPV